MYLGKPTAAETAAAFAEQLKPIIAVATPEAPTGLGNLKMDLVRQAQAAAAAAAAAAEAARIKAAIEAEVSRLVPTAEEQAEAFVEEMQLIAPTVPIEKPILVTPPDARLAPPAPVTEWQPRMVTTPVDSRAPTDSLIFRYHSPPAPEAQPTEKKGAGIGAALLVGIPIVLAMAG